MISVVLAKTDTLLVSALVHAGKKGTYKTRVYVKGAPKADEYMARSIAIDFGNPLPGENAKVDAAWREVAEQNIVNQRRVIADAAKLVLPLRALSLTYDIQAGCECGCQPGFIHSTVAKINGAIVESIFIIRK